MPKDKVCRACKVFVDGTVCPLCKNSVFANSYQGRLNILDANKSLIAKQINITEKGRYAIKVR